MLKCFAQNANRPLLYLDSRELACERQAELRAAVDQGYPIVMATPTPQGYRGYALEHVVKADVGNYLEAEKAITDYLQTNRLTPVGVVAWKDREVELAARLGTRLGLRCSAPNAAINVRNKFLTRRILDRFPGANPRYAIVRSTKEFIEALRTVGLPALLKPAGNSGSRGIKRVISSTDAATQYRDFLEYNARQSGDMFHYYEDIALLEQELVGSEHSVAGIVCRGQVVTLGIADKRFVRSLPLQYENVVPSRLPDGLQDAIVQLVQSAIEATGIDNCGFHVDFMVTDEGVKVLEIGGRLGGELINSHLIPLAQPGLHPYIALLEVIQGRNPFEYSDYTRRFRSFAGSRVVLPPRLGTIDRVAGIELVRRDPRCRDFMQLYGAGDEMVTPQVKFKSYEIGYIVAQCDRSEDISGTLDELAARVSITMRDS